MNLFMLITKTEFSLTRYMLEKQTSSLYKVGNLRSGKRNFVTRAKEATVRVAISTANDALACPESCSNFDLHLLKTAMTFSILASSCTT